jgi:prepilin-type N-terminal cleavage/methylation domain-containing protein
VLHESNTLLFQTIERGRPDDGTSTSTHVAEFLRRGAWLVASFDRRAVPVVLFDHAPSVPPMLLLSIAPLRCLTRQHRRAGFTLPEILIVIVIISLLALVAIPRFATANSKRHMESARMRVAAAVATARAAAIQKGTTVQFKIASNRVTVKPTNGDTTDLVSPVPLDVLYKVNVVSDVTIDFSARGFPTPPNSAKILLTRPDVAGDSVMISKSGMVQR